MTAARYRRVHDWFTARPAALRALRAADRLTTAFVYVAYGLLLAALLWQSQVYGFGALLRAVLIPAAVFVAGSLLRSRLDRPRPVAVHGIPPLLKKEKRGESFPSRHVMAASVITTAFFHSLPMAGTALLLVTLCIMVIRVLGGVHFVKDVGAGFAFGLVLGEVLYALL
ncbi:MAG: phosphatase PAP2 family protein [Oscillospiraceae bacterium]|nr:phosphatase PAP2 family protein [Oscillospiraceae bacterium]